MKLKALVFILALLIVSQAPALCQAQAGAEARGTLEKAIELILGDIRSPQFANADTRQQMLGKIKEEVRSIFDFDEFSSRTVGPRWKTFSAEQKKAFSDAFADLLFTTYLNKVTGYNGEKVDYTGETVGSDGSRVEVKTILAMGDGRKVPVSYRMMPKNGKWVVYDVIIENISLVKNYRTQFANILAKASPEELVEKVKERARELQAQGGANAK